MKTHAIARSSALGALLAVTLMAGVPAGAATRGITVTPVQPVTGKSTSIAVRFTDPPGGVTGRTPLDALVTTPFGAVIRVHLTHQRALRWTTSISFGTKGTWKFRVVRQASAKPLLSANVVVRAA